MLSTVRVPFPVVTARKASQLVRCTLIASFSETPLAWTLFTQVPRRGSRKSKSSILHSPGPIGSAAVPERVASQPPGACCKPAPRSVASRCVHELATRCIGVSADTYSHICHYGPRQEPFLVFRTSGLPPRPG